jgi:TM2 domain-containing membrane protein YozV
MRIPGSEVEPMYCKYCGIEIGSEADFCASCGKKLGERDAQHTFYRHELTRIKAAKELKNPKAAAALGFFFSWIFLGPVGYIYLGQWNWFWLTFIIQIFAYPLTAFFAYPLLPIVYGIHQYQMAKDVNELIARDQGQEPVVKAGARAVEPFDKTEL